jgi:hypothetical protein
MKQPNKIYLLDRDRAMEIMWYADSIYDCTGKVNYSDVKDKITEKEWLIIQMYFNNGYTADLVIENLKNNHPLYKHTFSFVH